MPHEAQANTPRGLSAKAKQMGEWSFVEKNPTATITVAVKGAASGETILEPHEFFRTNVVKELKKVLAIVKSNGPDEQGGKPRALAECRQRYTSKGRNGRDGGYQITMLYKGQEVQDKDSFQENQVELAAIFRTEYQVDDYFTGREFECPKADDEIPEGTYWAPG